MGRIVPNHLDILPPQSAYMGFWGVFDMAFWRSPPLLDFSDYMYVARRHGTKHPPPPAPAARALPHPAPSHGSALAASASCLDG